MGYVSPEQLEKDAAALLEEHGKGTLDDAAYDLSDDEELPEADDPVAAASDEGEKTDEEIKAEEEAAEADPEDEAAKAAADPADPVVDKRVLDAQKKMHEATGKTSRLQKIADDAQAENDALRAQIKSGKTAPLAPPKVRLSKDRVAQLQKDYPDLADVFQDIHDTQVENVQLREDLNSGLKDVKTERSEDNFMSEIKFIHKDAVAIQQSDEWTGWLKTQPSYIQRAIYEGATSQETVDIITDYKRETGRPVPGETAKSTETDVDGDGDKSGDDPAPSDTPSKLEQARKAASPTLSKGARQRKPGAGKGKTYSAAEIQAISDDPKKQQWLLSDEGEKYQQDVMKAMQEGRITN